MSNSNYFVEFNGYDYVVMFGVRVVAAFATIDEAFTAKRAFENRPVLTDYDKTPPAMRVAKQHFHQQM